MIEICEMNWNIICISTYTWLSLEQYQKKKALLFVLLDVIIREYRHCSLSLITDIISIEI